MPVPIRDVLTYYGFHNLPNGHRGWIAVRCNFHGDSQASASFSEQLEAYVCHACDMKGDGLALIMKREGIGYIDATVRAGEISPGWNGSGVSQATTQPRRVRALSLFDGDSQAQPRDDRALPARRRAGVRRISD
ncbi:hypothetical protein J7I86_19395 [Arthrobacter sp. ISL-95]|nr:hypothetical protein [Arthrobacter sp. ISL-95]